MKQEPIDVRETKQIMCRLTTKRIFKVTNDDRIYLASTNVDFALQDSPLEHNETIVSVLTGYNFEVLVVGKKRGYRLKPGWKFDDVDIFMVLAT